MKKIFIDCGFHHGEGLETFIDVLSIDKDWTVHVFEPNPECHMSERMVHFFLHHKLQNCFLHDQAVWTKFGSVKFSQENWLISNSGSPKNPCTLDGWASCITELQSSWPGLATPIEVPCIDFSDFLQRFCSDAEVYCKMDIEGAEFPVLRKLLRDGTVKHIKKIWIEFHERYIPKENRQTKAALIRELSLYTEVEEWD